MEPNIFQRATSQPPVDQAGRYERFNLSENPFPSEPAVNQASEDKRVNGKLYEMAIRKAEEEAFIANFVLPLRSDPNHLKMGFLADTSYVGRGNGKSAYLVNLQQTLNAAFCLDLTDGGNKCFAVSVTPEPGGRTRSFQLLVDLVMQTIHDSGLLSNAIGMLRYQALEDTKGLKLLPKGDEEKAPEVLQRLLDNDWFHKQLDPQIFREWLLKRPEMATLSRDSLFLSGSLAFWGRSFSADDILEHYRVLTHRDNGRVEFVFNDLVALCCAAGFNGGYVLIDDFERIPAFQNARQKKDFVLEMRTYLFDGVSVSAKLGFFTFFLVFHAGVPRLISEAWAESGLESRVPLEPPMAVGHIIPFRPLTNEHAVLLVQRYLGEYRLNPAEDKLFPFTTEALELIAEMSELNAARILKYCFLLLEDAMIDNAAIIDKTYVQSKQEQRGQPLSKAVGSVLERDAVDLAKRIGEDTN